MGVIDVVLSGKLLPGTDFDTAAGQFAALTKLDRAKVAHLLQSGAPTVVKRNVSPEIGERYRAAFTAIGVEVTLRPSETVPSPEKTVPRQSTTAARVPAQQPSPSPAPPINATRGGQSPSSMQGNDGQARNESASATDASGRDQAPPPPRDEGLQVRKVPASHGWLWVKEATDMYMDEQVLWPSMCLFPVILMTLIALIPYAGDLCVVLAGPVFAGGLMLAAHGQKRGEGLCFSSVFQGFHRRRNQLLSLGGLQLLMAGAFGVVTGIGMVATNSLHDQTPLTSLLIGQPLLSLSLGLVALTAIMAISMACWFGPCLVAIGGATAWKSFGISFSSTFRNWSAFLVFGLVTLVAVLAVVVVLALAGMLLQFALILNMPKVLLQIAILVLLSPIIALFTLTTYTAFRDIFLSGR